MPRAVAIRPALATVIVHSPGWPAKTRPGSIAEHAHRQIARQVGGAASARREIDRAAVAQRAHDRELRRRVAEDGIEHDGERGGSHLERDQRGGIVEARAVERIGPQLELEPIREPVAIGIEAETVGADHQHLAPVVETVVVGVGVERIEAAPELVSDREPVAVGVALRVGVVQRIEIVLDLEVVGEAVAVGVRCGHDRELHHAERAFVSSSHQNSAAGDRR